MKLKKLIIIPLVISATSLVSCANRNDKEFDFNSGYLTSDSVNSATNIDVQSRIAEASSSVSKSFQELSAVKIAKNPGVSLREENTPGDLSRKISFNWNGPVQQAVAKIASAIHYRLSVLGIKPSIPVLVNLNASNKSFATILRNIRFQAAPNVTIKTHPSSRVIELEYNPLSP